MDLNKAMVIGRLTRDPELRTTPQGQSVVTLGVATNRAWTDKEGNKKETVEFHNVVAWGKLAEIIKQYLSKGRRVYFEGRLQTREWQAQDGTKRTRSEIIAENMIMLDGRQQEPRTDTQVDSTKDSPHEEEPSVEDIPF